MAEISTLTVLEQAAGVIAGRIPYEKTSESVQSWLRLHIFMEACKVLELPFCERKAALCAYPESYREQLKAEVVRIFEERKNS